MGMRISIKCFIDRMQPDHAGVDASAGKRSGCDPRREWTQNTNQYAARVWIRAMAWARCNRVVHGTGAGICREAGSAQLWRAGPT